MSKSSRMILVFLLGVLTVYGADWASILKQVKAKYAGYKDEVKDITIVRAMKISTPKGDMTADSKTYKKGDKFRVETTVEAPNMPEGMQGMQMVVINDGQDVWMINPFMGKQKLPSEKRKDYERQEDWWSWLSDKGKIVGSGKFDGRDCYIVQFEIKDAPFTKIWLEEKDLIVVKAEFEGEKGHNGVITFSDYHKIMDKWGFPYKMEVYIDDNLQSTMDTKSVEVNQGLSDDLFNPDKVEVKGNMQEMMKQMMKEKGGNR